MFFFNWKVKSMIFKMFLVIFYSILAYGFFMLAIVGPISFFWEGAVLNSVNLEKKLYIGSFINPVYAWENSSISLYFYIYLFASYFLVKLLWQPFLKKFFGCNEWLLEYTGVLLTVTTVGFYIYFLHLNYCSITTCWWFQNSYVFYVLYVILIIPFMVRLRELDFRYTMRVDNT